jgi:murein DD-endopeptidase MepM/ murein hydrolase activator NlpD
MHKLELVLAVLVVLLGLRFIAVAFLPRRLSTGPHVHFEVRPRPRMSAHQLGLAHRLAARLMGSPRRPSDKEFLFVEQYTRDVDVTTVVFATPGVVLSFAHATPPLLELEELLERLERFTARVRSWRPGRRREPS